MHLRPNQIPIFNDNTSGILTMERLRLERARFELDVGDLVMKHIDKLKSSGVLQIEDRGEAAKKIRETMFGKYTKEQLEAAALATQ